MTSSALPQGFSIFQPALGAQLQFFPAVGTQELDELIHAYLVGPGSSQEKRATLALDFFEHAQLTGQSFKFYPVYSVVAASPATSGASSMHTSPATASWDWSQTGSRAASVSSRSSQYQHRVSKPVSPAARVRGTVDFASLPGMKIMTKDGLDVTNSASRGSKTKEQRDHAHLMRIIKACDSCKRKKIRCDPSHKKRGAAASAAPAPAATGKVTKKARTSSPSAASQSTSPQQSVSPQSISPLVMMDDFGSFSDSPFEMDAAFSFDALDAFAPTMEAPADLWDEFVQYPPVDQDQDYDFFADPESLLSSQSSDAELSAADLSASVSSPRSISPSGRGPGVGRAETHAELLDGTAPAALASVSAQLPYELHDTVGEYTDFNLFSPGSSFSEDERMLDIASSTSGLSTQSIPSPSDSPPRPQNVETMDVTAIGVSTGDAAEQSPFTRAAEDDPSDRSDKRDPSDRSDILDARAGGTAGAISVLSRSDVVMRTNEQGELIICCPPGTVVINSSGQGSTDAGRVNVSTVHDSSSSSISKPHELSEMAVASVSSGTGNVDTSVSTWLDEGSSGQASQLAIPVTASPQESPVPLVDTLDDRQPSRFVHRNMDVLQPQRAVVATAAADNDGLVGAAGLATETGSLSVSATGLGSTSASASTGLATASTNSSSEPASPLSLSSSPFAKDIFGGYVSDESGSLSPHSAVLDRSVTNLSTSSELANTSSASVASASVDEPSFDEPSLDDNQTVASVPSSNGTPLSSSSSALPRTDRPLPDSESAYNVSHTTTCPFYEHDTTGIGRTLCTVEPSHAVTTSPAATTSPIATTLQLAQIMQTLLTRTLLVTAYAQSIATTPKPSIRSRLCREYAPRSRNTLTQSARVPIVG
ncbi:hypothetical protein BB8028_0005g03040 [Beauveria bassiana]|uniref:Zn(2)-C6 fungal-type domain-containing protein n=1 Tax=Beauveria bassiana TaxID=176275 RepID=A0A2S7YF39_BEABA|nr:hypothetical protein BB8028_0005g03040 [Beauveria bassiana]